MARLGERRGTCVGTPLDVENKNIGYSFESIRSDMELTHIYLDDP